MDPFSILGLTPSATRADVRRAYRALARRYHPDVNPGHDATSKMRHINWAYDVLGDPRRRAIYERNWRAAHEPHSTRSPGFDSRPPTWQASPNWKTSATGTATGQPRWSPPAGEAARGGSAAREYAGAPIRQETAARKGRPSAGKILMWAWFILWVINTLAGLVEGLSGGSAGSSSAGLISEDPSFLLDDPSWASIDESYLYDPFERYADEIDAHYADMYSNIDDRDYSDLVEEHYGSLLDDYDRYNPEDEAAFVDEGLDSYTVDWPSYP